MTNQELVNAIHHEAVLIAKRQNRYDWAIAEELAGALRAVLEYVPLALPAAQNGYSVLDRFYSRRWDREEEQGFQRR